MISVEAPIFDLGFFVEFLAELKSEQKRERVIQERTHIKKKFALYTYFADIILSDSASWFHLESVTVGKTAVLVKELALSLFSSRRILGMGV